MLLHFLNREPPVVWPPEIRNHVPVFDPEMNCMKIAPHQREYGLQAPILFECALELDAKHILELGTREGISTRIFLEACRLTGGKVTSIDRQPCVVTLPDWAVERWRFIEADTLTLEWNEPVDLIYLDTSHEYGATLEELRKFYPLVKTPGLLICHDYDSHYGVKRAVTDFSEDMKLGFIGDTRGQGLAFFPKPHYPNQFRECREDRWPERS